MIKKHIAQSFGNASHTYDKDAPVQKWTALQLCKRIQEKNLAQDIDCLEIGCGTGFLTAGLLDVFPNANWTISDLSENMLMTCRNRVGEVGEFIIMDGEYPNVGKKFDLIVSSLAVQWFHNLEEGLKRLCALLKPGGLLMLTTMGKDSFVEWRNILSAQGLPVGLHDYPDVDEINRYSIGSSDLQVETIKHLQDYENALAFLKSLKAIGAHKPSAAYRPMTPGDLKKALKGVETETGCFMTYEIIFIEIQKEA